MPAQFITLSRESLRERMFILESRLLNLRLLLQYAALDEQQRTLLLRLLCDAEAEVDLVFRERIANEHEKGRLISMR